MDLIIFVNDHFEEEMALFNLENKEAILKGDYYHDKIDAKIKGYLKALADLKLYEKEVEEVYISSKHEFYKQLEFYKEAE